MKKYLFTGFVSTLFALLMFVFLYYLSLDVNRREYILADYLFTLIYGWFMVIPAFIGLALVNSYILSKIDIHFINMTLCKRKNILFIAGILTIYVLGLILFLAEYLFDYFHLDYFYIVYIIYCIAGYVFAIAIRKIFGILNWGSTTCNIQRKGAIFRALGAFILAVITFFYLIEFFMIVVGFVLYESNNRWCILRSFGKKTQIPESSEGQIIPTGNLGN